MIYTQSPTSTLTLVHFYKLAFYVFFPLTTLFTHMPQHNREEMGASVQGLQGLHSGLCVTASYRKVALFEWICVRIVLRGADTKRSKEIQVPGGCWAWQLTHLHTDARSFFALKNTSLPLPRFVCTSVLFLAGWCHHIHLSLDILHLSGPRLTLVSSSSATPANVAW